MYTRWKFNHFSTRIQRNSTSFTREDDEEDGEMFVRCFDNQSRAARVSRLKLNKLAAKEKSNLIIEVNITTKRTTTTKEGINLSENGAAQKASDPIIKSNSFMSIDR